MFGFLRSVKCDIIFKIFVTLRLGVVFEKRHTENLKSEAILLFSDFSL